MRFKRFAAAVATAVTAVALAACGNGTSDAQPSAPGTVTVQQSSSTSNAQPADQAVPQHFSEGKVTLDVIGPYNADGGYRIRTTGFTPGHYKLTMVNYPDGSPYPTSNLKHYFDPKTNQDFGPGTGLIDASGNAVNFRWDYRIGPGNSHDPGSTTPYTFRMEDTTGNGITFALLVPPNPTG